MGLAELYDRFQAIVTLDHRVEVLEEQMEAILPRLDEVFLGLVRLDGRIGTVKAETLAEFSRQAAGARPTLGRQLPTPPVPSSRRPPRRPRRSRAWDRG